MFLVMSAHMNSTVFKAVEIKIKELSSMNIVKVIKPTVKSFFIKGNLNPDLYKNCLGIVGSRKISSYGYRVLKKIIGELNENITIVSGFMSGVDTQALKLGLLYKRQCIAVLPCGIDKIYPTENRGLYYDILNSGGSIISEFEGLFGPRIWTYPRRNKLLASICSAIVVIEAKLNSGSLLTAKYGHEFNLPVLCPPGDLFCTQMEGNYQLLNSYANLIISGSAVNDIFSLSNPKNTKASVSELDEVEKLIVHCLGTGVRLPDELSVLLNIPINTILNKLNHLILQSVVFEKEGQFYAY